MTPGPARGPAPVGYLFLLVSGILLLVPGCDQDGRSRGGLQVGDPAPGYRAPTLEGDTLALEDLRGHPALLNVWATWCAPCRFEMPFLQSLHDRHREQGLRVVGISVDQKGSDEAVRSFLGEHGVTYTILRDRQMRAMDAFFVLGLPATYLIDGSGTIRFIRMGPISEQDEAFLDALARLLS